MPKDSEPVKRWGSVTGYVQCFIPESAIEKFRLNAKGGLQRLIKRLLVLLSYPRQWLTRVGPRQLVCLRCLLGLSHQNVTKL